MLQIPFWVWSACAMHAAAGSFRGDAPCKAPEFYLLRGWGVSDILAESGSA